MTNQFDALIDDFILDAEERLEQLEQVLLALTDAVGDSRRDHERTAKRELHTLKGNAGMMGLADLQHLAHAMEDVLVAADGGPCDVDGLLLDLDRYRRMVRALKTGANGAPAPAQGQGSVRVPFAVLDPLLDQVAEVVIVRNRLAAAIAAARYAVVGVDGSARAAWAEATAAHEALTRSLDAVQEGVMRLRLTPLEVVLGSLRRIVHDEAARAEKQAELMVEGGNTPLDKALLDLASDALGHLVRNAVIHGLEAPTVRLRAGKPARGAIRVAASVRGDDVWIEVQDDGAGIPIDAVRASAERAGIAFNPVDPYAVLFESGVSTRAEADLSAGRGVGLAAVRDAVRRQGGDIVIDSVPGQGTAFRMRLPMTVSIVRALVVRADHETYAVPLTAVAESRKLSPGDGHDIHHRAVIRWRDRLVPVVDLGVQFGTRSASRAAGYLVVVQLGARARALAADVILGVEEVVVRRLDPMVGRPAGVGGSTVLGDGRPILILDPRGLMELAVRAREAA